MKVIVAGGRNYSLTKADIAKLNALDSITELVTGGAAGVDAAAEEWAKRKGLPIKVFKPNWKIYGKGAGPIRNREMAEYADCVVLFPGGKGTESMYNEAMKAGIGVYDYREGGGSLGCCP